jgi:hypothetical protein
VRGVDIFIREAPLPSALLGAIADALAASRDDVSIVEDYSELLDRESTQLAVVLLQPVWGDFAQRLSVDLLSSPKEISPQELATSLARSLDTECMIPDDSTENPFAFLLLNPNGHEFRALTDPQAENENDSVVLKAPSIPLSEDQRTLLSTVAAFRNMPSWYKLGRVALGHLSSPSVFNDALRSLIEEGLLYEVLVPGAPEGVPALVLSLRGRAALRVLARESVED